MGCLNTNTINLCNLMDQIKFLVMQINENLTYTHSDNDTKIIGLKCYFRKRTSDQRRLDMRTELSVESNHREWNKEYLHTQITPLCIYMLIKVFSYPLAYTQFYIQEPERAKDPKIL